MLLMFFASCLNWYLLRRFSRCPPACHTLSGFCWHDHDTPSSRRNNWVDPSLSVNHTLPLFCHLAAIDKCSVLTLSTKLISGCKQFSVFGLVVSLPAFVFLVPPAVELIFMPLAFRIAVHWSSVSSGAIEVVCDQVPVKRIQHTFGYPAQNVRHRLGS